MTAGRHSQLACQCLSVHNAPWHDRTSAQTGPSEPSFLPVDTRMPYVVDYPGEDGGKTAHYMLRWVATSTEKRPWSKTANATIRT